MHSQRAFFLRQVLAIGAFSAAAIATGCSNGNNGTSTSGTSGTTTSAASTTSGTTSGPSSSSSSSSASSSGTTGTNAAATSSGSGTGTSGVTGSSGTSGTTSTTGSGGGVPSTVTAVANAGFTSPFDAVLKSDGTVAYFTALDPNGNSAVFSAKTDGTQASAPVNLGVTGLSVGTALAISSDDSTLFVTDLGYDTDAGVSGAILSILTSGSSSATVLTGTVGFLPTGVLACTPPGTSGDTLYFTGTDPTSANAPGVFDTSINGNSHAVVSEGAPFANPTALASNNCGTTFDVLDGNSLLTVSNNGNPATVALQGLLPGYPGGLSWTGDGTTLLLAGFDPSTSGDGLGEVVLPATGPATISYALSQAVAGTTTLNGLHEAAGLHTALKASAYVYVDSSAGGTGTVYVLR